MLKKTLIALGAVACLTMVNVPTADAAPAMAKAANKYYDSFENGSSVDWDRRLANLGRYYIYKEAGKEGLLDSHGKKLLDPVYSEIMDIDKDVVIVRKGSKYGLVKTNGMEIVMPSYSDITYDLDSKAFLAIKGKNSVYLDHKGNPLAMVRFTQRDAKTFEIPAKPVKGLAYSLANGGKVEVKGKKFVVTNGAGAKVATVKGDFLNKNYKGGFLVGDENKYNFYDKNMQLLKTVKAEGIMELPNGVFEITRTVTGLSVVGVMKTALSFYLDQYGGIADRWFNPGKKHNRREKVKFGYVDHEGNEFVPTKFDYLGNFYMGKALVMDNDRFGYVQENGSYPVPVEFDDISALGLYDRSSVVVKKDGKYGLYTIGQGLVAHGFDAAGNFVNGLAAVKNADDRWGYVDKSGILAIRPSFDQVTPFYDSSAVIKNNGVYGVIDRAGNLLATLPEAKEVSAMQGGSALLKTAEGYYLIGLQGEKLNALPYGNLKIFRNIENIRGKW